MTGDTAPDEELTRRARSSGLLITAVALVLVPAWGVFDVILEPQQAHDFIAVRLICEIPLLACLLVLWSRVAGRNRPELVTACALAVVQTEVSWMVVRAPQGRDFYLLGFSLALYASGCVMTGRPAWTGVVVVVTWLALVTAVLTAPEPMSGRDLVAAVFYLATASIIGMVGHVQRWRLSMRELSARHRLEAEQQHTSQLLEKLDRLSHEDSLTGLANRRRWDGDLERACAHARRSGAPVAVLLIDIDQFKSINDQHGHAGGDVTLREVADLLSARTRSHDLVARLGGDEYGVLLVDTDAAGAAGLAEQLREEALRLRPDGRITLSLSLGVASAAGSRVAPLAVMAAADRQLYRAKATRNAVAVAGVTTPHQRAGGQHTAVVS